MVMFLEPEPGSMPSVLRARRCGVVDFDAPDGEAVARFVGDVEVRRVLERDAVEGEVVGVVGDNEARDLLRAARACILGEAPCALDRKSTRLNSSHANI